METALHRLLPFFDTARQSGSALALATVINTAGSSYRKTGAQMLIATTGEYVGLLSGGCLEGDLSEHAQQVIIHGGTKLVQYDMRGPDDELWGLGAGCEGAMDILLQRVGPQERWQPLAALASLTLHGHCAVLTLSIGESSTNAVRDSRYALWSFAAAGQTAALLDSSATAHSDSIWLDQARMLAISLCGGTFDEPLSAPMFAPLAQGRLLALPYAPAPSLLLLGAGPDALPVVELANFLCWRVSVFDHRASLIDPSRFPAACTLYCGEAAQLRSLLDPSHFDAIVVMSHQLAADSHYLQALAAGASDYVGLLGPAPRREKLLANLSFQQAAALRSVLRAPVGIDLGGRSPEAIALGIVADIQAHLHGRRFASVAQNPQR